ncbi:unnamed protein product [Brachionus calyciflorus]|uniref:Uncharacterized protein n=1 Tax=Brachionus calyciflorus TaxID=104777 RepID=A0A814JXE0_9BILA|nr:unnamed protein product [Brachionus calyciflorus]
MVTKQNLNKSVSRDYREKIRKFDWILKCNEPFATPFKENINNDSYTSINNLFDDAAPIYRRHSPQYNEAKATVSSENGRRVHKSKEQENQESESDESEPNENIRFTKDQILNEISRNYIQFKDVLKLKNNDLKNTLNENNKRNEFLTNIDGYTQPNNQSERILCVLIGVFHDVIDNL